MARNAVAVVAWRAWFASPASDEAKRALQLARKYELPEFGHETDLELRAVLQSTKKLKNSDIRKSLESLTLEDLKNYIKSQTKNLEDAAGGWEEKRNKGWRKTRTKFQNFTLTFQRFLEEFGGVVEIAQLADNQYGGAATAILMVLFATVKIKAESDEAILGAMQTITDRLPDVDIYEKIYADSKLALMIATAYREVIIFCRQATIYFQARGISRAFKAIGNPARFPDMNESLVGVFTNIRVRCEVLLAQRVAVLSEQNNELLRQMKVLTDIQDAEKVRKLQKALGRNLSETKSARDDDLADYRRLIRGTLAQWPPDLSVMTLDDLHTLPEYHAWDAAPSSLLFLHGRNHRGLMAVAQSWLALATVDLITTLQVAGRGPAGSGDGDGGTAPLVAYEICSSEQAAEDVVGSLLAQLLHLWPAAVKEADDFRDVELRLARTDSGLGATDPLDDYSQALLRVVDRCDAPVYLVVSRPEMCRGGKMWKLLKCLIELVRETTNNLKIMTVVRTEIWDIEERLCDVETGVMDSGKFLVSRYDQYEM